jgi:thiol-disulfide isomerase/thioredoxin
MAAFTGIVPDVCRLTRREEVAMKTMFAHRLQRFFVAGGVAAGAVLAMTATPAWAKGPLPTPADALKLMPIQQDVDFERPAAADIEKCKVEVDTSGGMKSYVVIGPRGELLRRFVDSNGNNKVDMWCYYRDGVEVYRDIDSDGNGKADQYRWLGLAGIRWGIDKDEDTKIDSWKQISAEEVTEEVVAAVRTKDLSRFKRLLLTAEEVDALGLPSDRAEELKRMLTDAVADFPNVAKQQKLVTADTKWISFGGSKPGVFPVANSEQEHDIVVYDNVAAGVATGEKHGHVSVGTLVRIGDGWRVIDIPRNLLDDGNATPITGFFFHTPLGRSGEGLPIADSGISPQLQKLVTDLEKVDTELAKATAPEKITRLNADRADIIEQIIDVTKGEDRDTWIRQFAETLSAAAQSGQYPAGSDRLKKLATRLSKQTGDQGLFVFVTLRALQTDYNLSLHVAKEAQIPKIHSAWIEGLEQLVSGHQDLPETAEAMLALAQEYEISGKEKEAIDWYGRIPKKFPQSEFAAKAQGAIRRLELIGNRWMITGNTIDNKALNPAALSGKVVVVQYWATWCDQCKSDFATLKSLQSKYGKQGLQVIGVNLDSNKEEALGVLRTSALPWPTLHEPGGFESRFANELGIFTLPLMVLVDRQGKVVSRNITAEELDAEIRKLLK